MRLGGCRFLASASRSSQCVRAFSSTSLHHAPKAEEHTPNLRQAQRPRTSYDHFNKNMIVLLASPDN